MRISVQKMTPEAQLPTYAHEGDAGMDLYAVGDVVVAPQQRARVATGIAMAIPEGYVGLIWDKSGIAAKAGVTTLAGVVDASYRGEIQVVVFNTSSEPHTFKAGEKVAQMLIQSVEQADIVETSELDDTSRGSDGFGSTGNA